MLTKNSIIQGIITDITSEGHGVLKYDRFPVFVPYTVCGEEVEVKIIKVTKSYAVGRVEKICKDVDSHIDAKCPVYKQCGGCSLQHMTYEEELRIKQKYAVETLKRIGKVDFERTELLDIVGSNDIYHYRNKAEYPIQRGFDGKCKIGFYRSKSHEVIDHDTCLLQPLIFSEVVETVREFIDGTKCSIYEEESHQGLLRHLYIREAAVTKEMMVCLVCNGNTIPHQDKLVDMLTTRFPSITSIVLNENTKKSNVILGDRIHLLYGSPIIRDVLCGNTIEISPLSFYQVNHDQAERLYGIAKEFAELKGDEVLIDLYCGAGTIGLSMADSISKLYGVEIIEPAIINARRNAELNGITNAYFEAGDASILAKRLAENNIKPDVIVVDPPRKGISEDVIEACQRMNPKRIVYVSCNVATLARDIEIIERTTDYHLEKVQMVDLFPRTNHVECVGLLVRKDK